MSASASPGAEKGSMASEKNPPEHFDGGHYTNPDTIRSVSYTHLTLPTKRIV